MTAINADAVADAIDDLARSSRQYFSGKDVARRIVDEPDQGDINAAAYHLSDLRAERDDVTVWSDAGRNYTYQFVDPNAPEIRADGGEITVCPECDTHHIEVLTGDARAAGGTVQGRYRCNECGARFDDPATRPPRRQTAPNAGTAARALTDADPDVLPDGGTEGAVDHSFDAAERPTREVLQEEVADVRTATLPGSVALDLVTRQLLLVRRESYPDLAAHYEAEGYSLLSYGVHPYLPVTVDDAVYECVYLSDTSVESLANFGEAKTYDFPAGRLAHVPVEEAWGDA